MSVRWPSRYTPPVRNGLWLFRYECSAWLWMFYGLLKFYWVKSPNQSCHNSMQFLVDDQWDQISFYFYRNQWTGVRGGELLQQDLCSYLNVADPRMRSRKEKPPVILLCGLLDTKHIDQWFMRKLLKCLSRYFVSHMHIPQINRSKLKKWVMLDDHSSSSLKAEFWHQASLLVDLR